jgi:hypothetical protein
MGEGNKSLDDVFEAIENQTRIDIKQTAAINQLSEKLDQLISIIGNQAAITKQVKKDAIKRERENKKKMEQALKLMRNR